MRNPEELRGLVEGYLGELALTPELHGQADAVRYALIGGKRVRGVICLATAEAAGVEAEVALPAAASLELVHAFSLVHDDLQNGVAVRLSGRSTARRSQSSPATRCWQRRSGWRSRTRRPRPAASSPVRRSE